MLGVRLIYLDSDIFAGTERHVLDLLDGLAALGQPVALAAGADTPLAEHAQQRGHALWPIEKRGRVDWRAAGQLARWMRRGQVELIHAHNGRTALHAVLARRLARRGAVVNTQHFIAPTRTQRRGPGRVVSNLAHRWMSRGIDHSIAISNAVRHAMLERGDAPAERVSVVPNGIADPASDLSGDPQTMRRSLDVPADAPLIVCAARLQPEKDVASLVTAMARVIEAHPHARCVIAGEGVERDRLAAEIDRLGLGRCVHLLGFRCDVRAIMAAGDLFVLPAVAEGFGLVLIEAMALGRAVIAIRAGGPLDIVEHERTGLLVEPTDRAALAEAIVQLLDDAALCQRMGQAGRARFEAQFTAERMARATAAVYAQALASATCAPIQPVAIGK